MELRQTRIYPFIKGNESLCRIHHFEPGEFISRASIDNNNCWYVVDGMVKIYATSYNGKRIDVDTTSEDDFTGKLSNRWGRNFYCDIVAATPCDLLRFPLPVFNKLLDENIELELYFAQRCAAKAYTMFKRELSGRLFSQKQLFAAHLITNAKGSKYYIEDTTATCNAIHASNRNLYNLIDNFEKSGLISYGRPKTITIVNEVGLRELAKPVLDFNDNKY